jgi:iron complex outermembrane receptor protein
MKTSIVFRAFLLTYVFLFYNNSLQAQNLPETDPDSTVLEEVTVTATRRGETDIMTTPVSMTKLSGKEVEKYALRDLNDIAVSVPGLSAGTVSAFKSAQFAMRGVSETTIILYKESPVGVTLDEFVVPHIQTSNLEVFDIESIEVLRGPQGTLFGKNTTGGVIVVQTKRPVLEENSAEVQLQYGSFDTKKANMALNFAIGDTVALRFAGMYLNSDGYYKNNASYGPIGETIAPFNTVKHLGATGAGDGSSIGGDDVFSGRAKLLWSPNDDVNLLFQYEYVRDRGDSPPVVQESTAGYVVPLWSFVPAPPDENPVKNAGSTLRDDGKFLDIPGGHKVDIDGYYLNGDWAINDNYTLYFNAGKRKQKSRLPSSYGGQTGPISIFDATRDDDRKTTQVEVRLGSNLDGPINFVLGGFYQKDDTEFCVLQYVGFLDGFFVAPPDFFNDNPRILCNTQDAKAKAVYIDGTWDVTEKFNVTAGFRWTDEKKKWAGRPMRFALGGEPLFDALDEVIDGSDFEKYPEGVVYNDHKWTEPTYRVILGYDFTDELFGFFGYSRGFKSGGYNDQLGTQLDPITDLSANPTEPEIANSWEGGIKSTFADGAANIAINAYWVKYTDAQRTFNVSFPDGGQETLFFNAAEMTAKGVELEGAWAATDSLLFNYNVSYMDADFDKFEADTDFDGEIDVVLTGQPVTRAPKWMGSVDGTYIHPAGSAGNMEYKLRYSYEGKSVSSYSDVDPIFHTYLDSRALLDASITFYDAQNRFYFRLLGANLTDKKYRTGSLSVATLWIMSAYGSPRYFGLEFGGKLGW